MCCLVFLAAYKSKKMRKSMIEKIGAEIRMWLCCEVCLQEAELSGVIPVILLFSLGIGSCMKSVFKILNTKKCFAFRYFAYMRK